MKHPNRAVIAAIMAFIFAGVSLAQTIYPDVRPSANLRMDAKDQGVVLKHGQGPEKCDMIV